MPAFNPQGAHGVVRINSPLPSLQPTVTVVRVPAGTADHTQFANMTTAMGLPAGALGDQTKNLTLSFTWTNSEGYVWSYLAEKSRIAFSNPLYALTGTSTPVNEERTVDAARDFAVAHGFRESDYRNFVMASSSVEFPTLSSVTAERVVDERNIVDKDGRPEQGAVLYVNKSGIVSSGWMSLAQEPQRSDYPAITADEMRQRMEQGGLAGPPSGSVDIAKTFFAFVRLPRQSGNDAEFLAPALVGEGVEQLVQGGTRPYRIVVPLVK